MSAEAGDAPGPGADLAGRDLDRAALRGRDLRGANLAGARLRMADLGGANLAGADLRGADLRGANLCFADLRGARLAGVRWRGALALDAKHDPDQVLSGWSPPGDDPELLWEQATEALAPILDAPGEASLPEVLELLDRWAVLLHGFSVSWSMVAVAFGRAGREDAARAVLLAGLVLDPSGEVRHTLARRHLDAGELVEAKPLMERLYEQEPGDPHINADYGYLLGRMGELERAQVMLERAVAGGADGPNTYAALGMVRYLLGNGPGSVAAYQESMRRSGGRADHAVNLALALEAQGDLIGAAQVVGAERFRGDEKAQRLLVNLLEACGSLGEALAVYDRLLAAFPEDAELRVGAGELLLRLGSPERAVACVAGLEDEASVLLRARAEARAAGLPMVPRPATMTREIRAQDSALLPLEGPLLGQAREAVPGLGAFVLHVGFLSPYAISHVMAQDQRGARLIFLGSHAPVPMPARLAGCVVLGAVEALPGLPLSCSAVIGDLELISEEGQAEGLVALSLGGLGPVPAGVGPLFGGLGLGAALLAQAQAAPPTVQQRVAVAVQALQERYGVGELAGQALVIDGFCPDMLVAAEGGGALILPPGCLAMGDARWMRAQALAYLGLDREAFVKQGLVLARPGPQVQALLAGESAAGRRALVGLAYVALMRWAMGLGELWPARRRAMGWRLLALAEEVHEGRLLALI